MYRSGIMIAVIAMILWSCDDSKFETTNSGLQYKFVKNGEGPPPEEGNVILMNVSYTDENNNILFSSNQGDGALPLSYSDSMFARVGGIEEGIRMMREGDSVVLKFPIEDLFESTFQTQLPDSLRRGSEVTVCLGAQQILNNEQFQTYLTDRRLKQQEKAIALEESQFEADNKIIDEYLATENIKANSHESGLKFEITKQGNGPTAQPGQQVTVAYTGRLLDGKIFDTSYGDVAKSEGIYDPRREPYQPYTFQLGTGSVIRGWDIGIGLLNKGAKALLYVPSKLAYGPRQMGPGVPPNSILVFEVELVDIGE